MASVLDACTFAKDKQIYTSIMPTSILIAQQEKYGAFTKVGHIGFTASYTKIEIIDVAGAKSTFDIPETGLLSFKVTVSDQAEGDGQDYFITEQTAQSGATGTFELSTALGLKLSFQPSVEPVGLALKFIGEEEQDIMREMVGHSLIHNSEFGFQKKANSVLLEIF